MTIKENIGLFKSVLLSRRPVPGLSKLRLLSICKTYGVRNLYVGTRKDFFAQNDRNIENESKKTIFYYNNKLDEISYFDILNGNVGCDSQKDGVFVIAPHVATNLQTLQSCFDRPKVKCIGGRK